MVGSMGTLGERIKAERVRRNQSQADVGRIVGKVHSAVAKWEAGRNEPGIADLQALAGAWDLSFDYLATGRLVGPGVTMVPSDDAAPLNVAPAQPDARSGGSTMEQDPDAEPMVPLRMLDDALQVAKDNAQAVKAMVAQVQTLIDRLPEPQTVSLPAQGEARKQTDGAG
jgi:transcriptional regulator with XRE-family HTH domain